MTKLQICPGMRVSNAPRTTGERIIIGYQPFVDIRGKRILTAPISAGCLSSGYGRRNGRLHRGLDYHSRPASNIHASASGTVVEKTYRQKDFGHMLVIDHGDGIYTRYAHLQSIDTAIVQGRSVKIGQRIGVMGKTGNATRAVHLHYEILMGDFDTPARSFGLTAVNPFTGKR